MLFSSHLAHFRSMAICETHRTYIMELHAAAELPTAFIAGVLFSDLNHVIHCQGSQVRIFL